MLCSMNTFCTVVGAQAHVMLDPAERIHDLYINLISNPPGGSFRR